MECCLQECGFTGKTYTYAQLRKISIRLASFLVKLGLQPNDVVTLILPNIAEFPAALLGALEAGLIVSPINPLYTADEILQQVEDSNCKCIITHTECLSKAISVQTSVKSSTHSFLNVICINDSHEKNIPEGIINFSEIIKEDIDTSSLIKRRQGIKLDDTALLPYSSGTTGMPKGVCLTHNSLNANIAQLMHPSVNLIEPSTGDYQSVVPGILPFFHLYGLGVVMFHALKKGAKLATLPKFDIQAFLKLLYDNKEITLYVAPPVILFLGSHPSVKPEHLEHINSIITGGAPCGVPDIERIQDKRRINIFQGISYGMTEASPVVTFPSNTCSDVSSVGAPISLTLGKVVCPKNPSIDLSIGEIGELCFKGPQIMKGYHNQPLATANTIDKDGWLHTGDLGYVLNNDNFTVVDRVKELIKVKGFQVAPAELEEVLRTHPDIEDAGVTSLPCKYSGETPVAFIVPKGSSSKLDTTQIQEYVSKKVAPYKQISQVFKIDKIPKSLSGKILRRELKLIVEEMERKK
ncbi:hypothetical protein AAG570_008621 [Ranatra chinensis]|uniref:4-coumarate--CoA ligase n=1 Tax=Ranatra chinensis TaxID=642074 RepID=A0ABD0YRE5_9HEMI